jgi:selenocysteine lyase/cysteine desulfurase
MSFATLRDSIRATRDVIYLNTGFTGPSPQPVLDRIREVLEREASVGPASPDGLKFTRGLAGEAQEAVAGLLNATPEEIILTHGTTEGVHVVIYGMKWQPGDEMVTCNLEHPALGTPASVIEERYGAVSRRVEISPQASAGEIVESFAGAINEKTKLVALSHVQFSCGLKLPIKAIADAAHRQGVPIIVDGAQTGGQLNIDVRQLGVDYYSISGQKWLLGPNGTGALFVNGDGWRNLEPPWTTHAIADARAVSAETGPPRPAQRFRIASQSPALTAGFTTAIGIMREIGLDAVEAYSARLADRLRAGVARISGCSLTGPASSDTSCGLASVAVEGWEPSQVVQALWDRWRIAVRAVALPPAIRISCAPFNVESDVDTLLDALRTIAREKPPELVPDAH